MSEQIEKLIQHREKAAQLVESLFSQFNQAFNELRKLDAQLEPRLSSLTKALYGSTDPSESDMEALPSHKMVGIAVKKLSKFDQLEPLVESILKEHGPLSTQALFRLVQHEKFDVGGKRPSSNMAAHLTRSKIISKGPNGWQLFDKAKAPTLEGEG
jgi:hypothetical protein